MHQLVLKRCGKVLYQSGLWGSWGSKTTNASAGVTNGGPHRAPVLGEQQCKMACDRGAESVVRVLEWPGSTGTVEGKGPFGSAGPEGLEPLGGHSDDRK